MKIIVAPDKFKGSLSSMQACKAIEAGIRKVFPSAEIVLFPMADGGDGFDEVLQHYLHTNTIDCNTVDPLMRQITASYQYNTSSKIAIIALSAASGLVLLENEKRTPMFTSTYGSGLIIRHAIEQGAEKIILGLGGSATNDAGMGILLALGFQLLDENGVAVDPVGKHLKRISRIIPPAKIPAVDFEIACDVENVLFGKDGAAFVYGAQKGASGEEMILLDEGLQHIAEVIKMQTGKSIAGIKGTGAAGGVAAGLMAYFDCKIISGAAMVIAASGISKEVNSAAFIITGEGKLDEQSINGKVIQHIAELGKQEQVPVIALCGAADISQSQMIHSGLSGVYQLMNENITRQYAVDNAAVLLTALSSSAVKSFFN
jgi:glycerate kinase